jgi:hypothetical protein
MFNGRYKLSVTTKVSGEHETKLITTELLAAGILSAFGLIVCSKMNYK